MPSPDRILYCRCAYSDAIPRTVKDRVLEALVEADLPFLPVVDLCALSARKDPMLRELARSGGLVILACHERAVRALFEAGGAPLPADGAAILNMRTQTPEAVLKGLPSTGNRPARRAPKRKTSGASLKAQALRKSLRQQADADRWIPWFPVIDRARCTDCRKCLGFCLFGVFALSADGRVRVEQPANCKTFCPACARVCPEGAIMFPKHPTGPVNGGEPSEGAEDEAMKVDLSRLTQGDLYAALRARGIAGPRRASGGGSDDGPDR